MTTSFQTGIAHIDGASRGPIPRSDVTNIGVIGTYGPRICGIATFTGDLIRALKQGASEPKVRVAALKSPGEALSYPFEVTSEIRQENKYDYFEAADAFNRGHMDAVSLQHEFGIFGGPDGDLVLSLMARLRAPVVTTFHTVLRSPSEHQAAVMRDVARLSASVVVMSETARQFLIESYGVPFRHIEVIPHGVPGRAFADSAAAKQRVGLAGKRVILTFGLLSQNKGIEYMIRALPAVIAQNPNVTYVVLGASHPLALDGQGREYVTGLKRFVEDAGLQGHVNFVTRFVELDELCTYLGAADVYVTPYLNEDQITSGTLSYAMGCGTAVVSTPYWHAKELLAEGRGRLAPFRDSEALAREVNALLADEAGRQEVRHRAYEYSRAAVWPEVGRAYLHLLESVSERGRRTSIALEPERGVNVA